MSYHGKYKNHVTRKQTGGTPRQGTATIAELAREGNMDPRKLLNCVKATYPQAVMQSPITADALRLAFSNYEQRHNIGDPASTPSHPASDTAQSGTGINSQRGNNTMHDQNTFYDETATDAKSKREWDADASLRQEFHGNYETWKHYCRATAQGLVRVIGGRHG